MNILVTNDDGIYANGLWTLARGLKNMAQVVVVAPDREQSGIGTAITLKQPLQIQEIKPVVPEIKAHTVNGTPADSVILALEKLFKNEIDLVISGINQGPNLGYDALVSGTVGAALQGYLHGYSALAVSVFRRDGEPYLDIAAKATTLLAEKLGSITLPASILLNVNFPDLELTEIKGIKSTCLAGEGHISAVEEGSDEEQQSYYLLPHAIDYNNDETTDVGAVKQGYISITALHTYLNNKSVPIINDDFYPEFLEELRKSLR
jgi:5'-nucleotidase